MSDQPTDPGSTDPSATGGPTTPSNPWSPPPQTPYPPQQPSPYTSPVPPPATGAYVPPQQGQYQPPQPAPGQSTGPGGFAAAATPTAAEAKGFFSALFDLSFSRFITPMIIKFVYVLMIVVIAIVYLFYAILLLQAGNSSIGVLWLLVVGPIASILWLAIARMTLEFYLAVVRVSEDVHKAVGRGGQ